LDAALSAGDSGRTDWQRRAIVAIRTMNLATVMQRPATRIILMATALEALLGNTYAPGGRATGGHQLSKRAAYLYCGTNILPTPDPHGPGRRGACGILLA